MSRSAADIPVSAESLFHAFGPAADKLLPLGTPAQRIPELSFPTTATRNLPLWPQPATPAHATHIWSSAWRLDRPPTVPSPLNEYF